MEDLNTVTVRSDDVSEDTFESYYQRIKDDFYNTLSMGGIDKHDLPPMLIQVTETKLLEDAKMFWRIKTKLDEIEDSRESFAAEYGGEKTK